MREPTALQRWTVGLFVGAFVVWCASTLPGCIERMSNADTRVASGLGTIEQCNAFCAPQHVHEWKKSEWYASGSSCECEAAK